MSIIERYLTLWVFLCIIVGVILGQTIPVSFHWLGGLEIAKVNLPVGILIWVMIIPMLLRIDFSALHEVRKHWRGIGVTLFINWAVKPFSMALLGWLFIRHLFAPLVALLLGLSAIVVPWDALLVSVVLYIVLPVLLAQVWRKLLLTRGEDALQRTLVALGPISISALLLTLVLLFAFQGKAIVGQPLIILMLAVPITIQVYFTSGFAYWLNRRFGEQHCVAGPSALIGASNFFELAVAAAISLFGFESGAALATVVGVLIEVPVMLSVVYLVKRSQGWYERA